MVKLALLFLILAIILSLVYSLDPTSYNKQCLDGPHVLVQHAGNNVECHKCRNCPHGKGMSVKCAGQFVSSLANIECVDCIPGFNYSNGNDHQQCIACPKACENQEVRGKCMADGDDRECVPCKKGWYFGKVHEKCLPCSCHNMSAKAREKCLADGFPLKRCRTLVTNMTSPRPTHKGDSNSGSKVLPILLLIGGLISAIIIIGCYLYFVGKRLCKFKENNQGCPNKDEWIEIILCCPYVVSASEFSTATSERGAGVHDNLQPLVVNSQPNSQCHFDRQNSCPVTKHEKKDAKECLQKKSDCPREKIKVLELGAEVCRKLYILLKKGNDTGIGYTTLAGLMGYSGEKVFEFESTDDPAKGLVIFWSETLESNNVLKFIGFVNQLERDDIVELLEKALPKCECGRCLLV